MRRPPKVVSFCLNNNTTKPIAPMERFLGPAIPPAGKISTNAGPAEVGPWYNGPKAIRLIVHALEHQFPCHQETLTISGFPPDHGSRRRPCRKQDSAPRRARVVLCKVIFRPRRHGASRRVRHAISASGFPLIHGATAALENHGAKGRPCLTSCGYASAGGLFSVQYTGWL